MSAAPVLDARARLKLSEQALREIDAARARTVGDDEKRKVRRRNLHKAGIPLEEHMPQRVGTGFVGRIELRPEATAEELSRRCLEPTKMLLAARAVVHVARNGIVPKPFLTLLGSPGRGKGTAGAHVIGELGGMYVKFERACELRKRERVADGELWDEMLASKVLVVDELGLEESAAAGVRALQDLVDERNSGGKVTVLISNLSEADIRERYDARTIDRLATRWQVVVDGGKSFRHPSVRRDWRVVLRLEEASHVDAITLTEAYVSRRQYRQAQGAPIERFTELDWAWDQAAVEIEAQAALERAQAADQ